MTVTHISQVFPQINADMRCNASERAAQAKVASKERLYKEQCAAQNVEFMSAGIFSYSGWLPDGIVFIKRLAAWLADRSGQDKSIIMLNIW